MARSSSTTGMRSSSGTDSASRRRPVRTCEKSTARPSTTTIIVSSNKTGGGPIVDPVIPLGNGDTIDGTVDFNAAGAVGGVATNNLVVWYRNPFGLAKLQGYIENTGVNNITVREQYISQNEGTFTRSTVIVAGGKLILDPYNFTGFVGLDNQVVDYRVDVSGTTISWHTYFPGVNGVTAT
jgi:hypothetical protein